MNNNKFILEFIGVYRSMPALWNIQSKEYSDRILKNKQYETLLKKYQEKFPEATKKEMCQKINCLRSAYQRELRRIHLLEESGVELNENNAPSLFYFEAMEFLRDVVLPSTSKSSILSQNKAEDEEPQNKRKKPDPWDEFMILATKRLSEPTDVSHRIGLTWAMKLKNLDKTQRIFAEKFINDIICEAELGTLHRNAMILNVSSNPYPH